VSIEIELQQSLVKNERQLNIWDKRCGETLEWVVGSKRVNLRPNFGAGCRHFRRIRTGTLAPGPQPTE
jgi:hypothetical protein